MQRRRRSNSKDPQKIARKEVEIRGLFREYIKKNKTLISKAETQIDFLRNNNFLNPGDDAGGIRYYIEIAKVLQGQIVRRVLKGEKINHDEKIFSIFEPHTEWVVKGKAGVSQELGLKTCIITDQHGFILSHLIMEKCSDSDVAVPFVQKTQRAFPTMKSCSFDKGFWSVQNKDELEKVLEVVALPKKGKLSLKDKERQSSDDFKKAKKGHSAVESSINALENHGLDYCPDKGIKAYKRYISLAVLGRNIQKLGAEIIKKDKISKIRSEAIKAGLERKINTKLA